VNAALVHTVLLAYPGSRVMFLGESGHRARVHELLETQAPEEAGRVEWKNILIPPRHAAGFRRAAVEWSTIRETLNVASRSGATLVLFASATEVGYLLLKIQLAWRRHRVPVLAVMHGALASIAPDARRKRLSSIRGMRLVFRLPHPRQLRYVALGDSILQSLREIRPAAARHTVALDIPFSWTVRLLPQEIAVRPSPVRFGYFGVSGGRGKGFDTFVGLADEFLQEFPDTRFMMIGHLSTEADRTQFGGREEVFPTSPLSPDEYARRAQQVTYALSVTDPRVYRFGASTSFLDALSSVKPGIYLRNPYLEHCFAAMGDIGYLCNTLEDVRACIRSVLMQFPSARYVQQCKNIFAGRIMFEPATLSSRFYTLTEEIRRSL
jgi:hypothetical protein